MYVSRLRLLCFRIYREAALELVPGVNLVVGSNGQGKTSLLEAIATLALTRSPRSGSLSECASWGESRMGVSALLRTHSREVELELRAERSGADDRWTRRIRRDGDLVQARSLVGALAVVLFWPEDLLLVKGGPEPRRRLLDVVLSQISRDYAEAAVRYRRVVEHRGTLLRRLREGGSSPEELRPWTEALVDHGGEVMAARQRYLEEIQPFASEAAAHIGEPGGLSLQYRPGTGHWGTPWDPHDPRGSLRRASELAGPEELARGQCLVGPHRDDFEILLGGRSARQFASQGQQRSLVLALKAAEVRQHLVASGETPVLMLDDVLSELDRTRRGGLIRLLSEELQVEQTLITATEDQGIRGEVAVAQTFVARAGSLAVDGRGPA